jgi:hypothetical protein
MRLQVGIEAERADVPVIITVWDPFRAPERAFGLLGRRSAGR